MPEEGRYASISAMAMVEKLDRRYLGCIVQLTLLAPDTVEPSWTDRSRAVWGCRS